MRKMLTAMCFIFCLGSIFVADSGRAQTGENEFGLYADPSGDPGSVNSEANVSAPFDVYFVLTNPVHHNFNGEGIFRPVAWVVAWEAKIFMPTTNTFVLLNTEFPVGNSNYIDIGIKPDEYIVSFRDPVPVVGNAVTLMTMNVMVLDAAPYEIYLGLTNVPSIPGVMGYTDDEDQNHSTSVVPAYPSSGSYDAPVFSINSPGAVVATENESWGSVKSLFR